MSKSSRVVVVGAGLLGGSLLAALQNRREDLKRDVAGLHLVAVSGESTLTGLRHRDWCDELFGYDQLEDACDEADLVVLCAPLASILSHLSRLGQARDRLARHAIVTDVGSTKSLVCTLGFESFPDEGDGSPRFVGGHPMAGSERSGLDAADLLLFQSALWVMCPPKDLPAGQDALLRDVVQASGARQAVLDPWIHDAAVARISHVPQILSSVLAQWTGKEESLSEPALALAAGGFRDMTRLSLSRWEVWRDIVSTNPAPIARALSELSQEFQKLSESVSSWESALSEIGLRNDPEADLRRWFSALSAGQIQQAAALFSREPDLARDIVRTEELLSQAFGQGADFRKKFRMPRKGIAHDLTEFVVRLEDRPGQMLALLQPLAQAGINVQDLEILKVREGESGTALLGFATPEDAQKAREVLGTGHFLIMDR